MDDKNIQYLEKCIDENKLSHAFLVEADNFEEVIQKIADLFVNEAVDNCYGISKVDMSIFVCKLIKNN